MKFKEITRKFNYKKKIVAVMMAAVLVSGAVAGTLTGCGSADDTASKTEESSSVTEKSTKSSSNNTKKSSSDKEDKAEAEEDSKEETTAEADTSASDTEKSSTSASKTDKSETKSSSSAKSSKNSNTNQSTQSTAGTTNSGSQTASQSSGQDRQVYDYTYTTETHNHEYVIPDKYVDVLIAEAYDEPVYESIYRWNCGCGFSTTDPVVWDAHNKAEADAVSAGDISKGHNSWGTYDHVQVGTIHHDAVYDRRPTVYRCECGAELKM